MSRLCSATAMFSLLAVIATARAADDKTPAARDPRATAGNKDPKSPRVLVTISKETTYITEPLRKDGYVDYVAALNERASRGVTPENNAAVLLWQAVGPAEIEPKLRDEYFRMLGMAALPEKGDYFVPFEEYLIEQRKSEQGIDAVRKSLESAVQRAWTANEFPILARWLSINEKPLSLVIDASNRTRRYDPLVSKGKPPVMAVLMPALKGDRGIATALAARAMLRITDGKTDAAWNDLRAVHRLARLAGQCTSLIAGLGAVSIDSIACHGDEALLQHAHLSAAEAERMLDDVRKLPRLPKVADKIDFHERFQFLDAVACTARDGFDEMTKLTGRRLKGVTAAGIDWDLILRMGNSWYDRTAHALRQPSRARRQEALHEINHDFDGLAAKAKDKVSTALAVIANSRQAASERVGLIFLALLMPAITAVNDFDDRATMQFELTKLGFALAEYHADRGAYPVKLTELVPKYVAEIPEDVFNSRELRYKSDGNGYLLYSGGVNGEDDGGIGFDDAAHGKYGDDLSIRVRDPNQKQNSPVPK